MAPASHRPQGGARGRGTGRGASGKGGPVPSAHGRLFPGARRAPWGLLAAKVPRTRAWPGEPSPLGRRPGPGDRPGSIGEGRARALGPRPALPRHSPRPPGASWRPKFLRRGHGPGEPSPRKGPTKFPKGQQGHRMSKGQQGPKGKQDLEDYIERQAKKGGCICFEYAFSRGGQRGRKKPIYMRCKAHIWVCFFERGSGDGRSQYICAAKHVTRHCLFRARHLAFFINFCRHFLTISFSFLSYVTIQSVQQICQHSQYLKLVKVNNICEAGEI